MAEEPRVPTTEKLAEALIEVRAPGSMIQRAKEGYYDDFKSPLVFPIRELVMDAQKHNLTRIAERAEEGGFDAQDWEARLWAQSPEGRAMLGAFPRHD